MLYSILISRYRIRYRDNCFMYLFNNFRVYNSVVRKLRSCIFPNGKNNNANCIRSFSIQNIFNHNLCNNINCKKLAPNITG